MKYSLLVSFCLLSFLSCKYQDNNYLNANWILQKSNADCSINYTNQNDENCFVIDYELYEKGQDLEGLPNNWVSIKSKIKDLSLIEKYPIVLSLKAESNDVLELKFIDKNGAIFGVKLPLINKYKSWTNLVIYPNNIEYMWGGKDDVMDKPEYFEIAVSGRGQGKIYLKNLSFDIMKPKSELPILGPVIDSLYNKSGFGFLARRDSVLKPEDPLILGWLKNIQDFSSVEKMVLPSQEDNEISTFNNALVAMAFIVKNEKERAERILDFYNNARKIDNDNINLQNFYYKGEARGYYQYVGLKEIDGNQPFHQIRNSDRWMGDNVWLMIAYLYYQKQYQSEKYNDVINDLKELLISWYTDAEGPGGYLGHGWRRGDSQLHESHGHEEGNIDAYAMFKLMGENDYADSIKLWLDLRLQGKNYPLDLYTWRTLAYGKEYACLLDIPEFDFRYRKIIDVNGKPAMGFYHGPDININNVWLDGTGHIACAYITCGDKYRGYFYANQMDNFITERNINNKITHSIPYTYNKTGGYEWVNPDKGFISVAAWYIFAKNKFNPFVLSKTE
ncbi:MAG: hypothetical protein PF517_07465 [Salinivirgaceae bacterium]|jgi:hypothetical protein|nr:hypothetical protein [Salinivirgaceae bacterium]